MNNMLLMLVAITAMMSSISPSSFSFPLNTPNFLITSASHCLENGIRFFNVLVPSKSSEIQIAAEDKKKDTDKKNGGDKDKAESDDKDKDKEKDQGDQWDRVWDSPTLG